MNQKTDREALRIELLILLEGLDYYRSWRILSLKRQHTGIPEESLVGQVVMSGQNYLQIFDENKGKRCAEVLKEVRIWYSHTASDLNYFASLSEDDRCEVRQFLDDFQKNVGFCFHAKAGTLRKMADRVLKHGKVKSEEEYYALNELRNDLSQTILKGNELTNLSAILNTFEANSKALK